METVLELKVGVTVDNQCPQKLRADPTPAGLPDQLFYLARRAGCLARVWYIDQFGMGHQYTAREVKR